MFPWLTPLRVSSLLRKSSTGLCTCGRRWQACGWLSVEDHTKLLSRKAEFDLASREVRKLCPSLGESAADHHLAEALERCGDILVRQEHLSFRAHQLVEYVVRCFKRANARIGPSTTAELLLLCVRAGDLQGSLAVLKLCVDVKLLNRSTVQNVLHLVSSPHHRTRLPSRNELSRHVQQLRELLAGRLQREDHEVLLRVAIAVKDAAICDALLRDMSRQRTLPSCRSAALAMGLLVGDGRSDSAVDLVERFREKDGTVPREIRLAALEHGITIDSVPLAVQLQAVHPSYALSPFGGAVTSNDIAAVLKHCSSNINKARIERDRALKHVQKLQRLEISERSLASAVRRAEQRAETVKLEFDRAHHVYHVARRGGKTDGMVGVQFLQCCRYGGRADLVFSVFEEITSQPGGTGDSLAYMASAALKASAVGGDVTQAQHILSKYRKQLRPGTTPDPVVYDSALSVCIAAKDVPAALSFAEMMVEDGLRPAQSTHAGVLATCRAAGDAASGLTYWNSLPLEAMRPNRSMTYPLLALLVEQKQHGMVRRLLGMVEEWVSRGWQTGEVFGQVIALCAVEGDTGTAADAYHCLLRSKLEPTQEVMGHLLVCGLTSYNPLLTARVVSDMAKCAEVDLYHRLGQHMRSAKSLSPTFQPTDFARRCCERLEEMDGTGEAAIRITSTLFKLTIAALQRSQATEGMLESCFRAAWISCCLATASRSFHGTHTVKAVYRAAERYAPELLTSRVHCALSAAWNLAHMLVFVESRTAPSTPSKAGVVLGMLSFIKQHNDSVDYCIRVTAMVFNEILASSMRHPDGTVATLFADVLTSVLNAQRQLTESKDTSKEAVTSLRGVLFDIKHGTGESAVYRGLDTAGRPALGTGYRHLLVPDTPLGLARFVLDELWGMLDEDNYLEKKPIPTNLADKVEEVSIVFPELKSWCESITWGRKRESLMRMQELEDEVLRLKNRLSEVMRQHQDSQSPASAPLVVGTTT
eukprot:Sspe_Gene.67770::Locus_39980_Transcript_1_1_Confidence_1.000_Length_3098::g.67770::m.67770